MISINNLVLSYVLKVSFFLILSGWAIADTCIKDSSATLTSVKRVIDADTVELSTGQRVRLIGVDAPELGYRGQADEPFAREGKQALEQKLRSHGHQIWVQLGEDPKDRYDRLLADLFFTDGRSVQGWLLEQGWVMQVFIAPNLRYADCLYSYEQKARQESRGIWSLPEYEPGIASTSVPSTTKGAVIITGKVERIGRSQANIWLNLDGGVAIQIPRRSLENFSQDIDKLEGKSVRVRGWIIKDNSQHHQWRIRIEDGRALEVLTD
ncbi:MAG: hypothetical protein EA373_03830 [Oceanospirillales bacterium]|nr:MAG: hypothetical protein EA373_03830 [Oceanospirillales bacterium]